MNYAVWLKALQAIPGVVAAVPEIKTLFEQAMTALSPMEQSQAKQILKMADTKSDQLHQTLQSALAAVE